MKVSLKSLLFLSLFAMTSAAVFAYENDFLNLDFHAPTIFDHSTNVDEGAHPQGTIVFDSKDGRFYGIGSNGTNVVWRDMSPTGGVADSQVTVTTGNGHGGTNVNIRRFSGTASTMGSGVSYADSSGNGGTFTINEDGIYSVTFMDRRNSGAFAIGVSLNCANLVNVIAAVPAAEKVAFTSCDASENCATSGTFRASAGDIVRAHTDGNPDSTSATGVFFRITQIVKF